MTIDFGLFHHFCRLIFWDTGDGHIEALHVATEQASIDERFDVEMELAKDVPFENMVSRLRHIGN